GKKMRKRLRKIGAVTLVMAMAASVLPGNIGKAYTPGNYSYFDEYTLGWKSGIVAYQNGTRKTLAQAGVPIFDKEGDRPFKAVDEQQWDADVITLTQPVKYTTDDGEAHDVESMLTNFDFIADPTAIDNSDVDGKLYVYGTTEGFSYDKDGKMVVNGYDNHSLTILSTEDMVNWTDEGFMDSANLTNEPSDSDEIVQSGYTRGGKIWAPSGLKIDGDGDGDEEFYLFFTNGGAGVGYVVGDSPTGPWRDPLGKALFTNGSPNCAGVIWCFDPAVLCDDKGDCYVYFGGGVPDKDKAHGKTGRVCKITFEEGTGDVLMDGEPQELDAYYLFEDSEINQFNGKYYYSYCTNYDVPGRNKWVTAVSIAVFVGDDPMNLTFAPEEGVEYIDKDGNPGVGVTYNGNDGTYRHFLGTVLQNPSVIYGQSYNNHHHMQSFKGKNYILYHSTVLNNSIHRESQSYRNLHVDEIDVNSKTDAITIEPSYEGAKQIEAFNPYVDFKGNVKEINATTTSYSAGVCSRRSDSRVYDGLSPMVLDEIDTGDWTKIQGVDFGSVGANKLEVTYASETDEAAIELFVDDPTNASNLVATVPVKSTGDQDTFTTESVDIAKKITGNHDIYFVFRGTNYDVAAWKFSDGVTGIPTPTPTSQPPVVSPTPSPTATTAPVATPPVDYSKTYKVGKLNYKVSANGTATVTGPAKKTDKSATVPATVSVEGKSYKVTSVAANAFKNCKKLTSVTIGSNVNKIGAKAFYNCKALKKITVKSSVIKSVGSKALKGTSAKLTIKVPKKKVTAYKKTFKGKGQSKKARIK
ncbi:MAG: carbohydrate-binding protein, partial [Lachnospiraceae bacterium]|nr:carbohydrate-binding protein [Lachnospiraceae bacterium]